MKNEEFTLSDRISTDFKEAARRSKLQNKKWARDLQERDKNEDGIPDRLEPISDKDVSGSDNKDLCDEMTVSSEKELRSKMRGMNIPKGDKEKIEKEIDEMNKSMKVTPPGLDVANTSMRKIQNILCTYSKEDKENIDEEEIEESTGASSAGAYVSNFGTVKKNGPLFKSNVASQMSLLTKEQLLSTLNEDKISVGKATEVYRNIGLTLQHFKKEQQEVLHHFKSSDANEKESIKPVLIYYHSLIKGLEGALTAAESDMETAMGADSDDELVIESTGAEGSSGEYSQTSFWVPVDKNFKPKTDKIGHGKKTIWNGGKFVKVKEHCRTFPYCNQGDINALELTNRAKAVTESIHKETGMNKNVIKSLILRHMTKF